jgi:hypothetical protein
MHGTFDRYHGSSLKRAGKRGLKVESLTFGVLSVADHGSCHALLMLRRTFGINSRIAVLQY